MWVWVMRLIILFIILISIFVGYIKISSLIEQNNLLNKYQYLVESNKNEIAILNRYILEKSNRNHRNFNRLDDYYTIDRKEFADTFPIFHKNGFNVVFLYPNSQCALISTNKALANELLFCINKVNLENGQQEDSSKLIGFFQANNKFWYYLQYRYL